MPTGLLKAHILKSSQTFLLKCHSDPDIGIFSGNGFINKDGVPTLVYFGIEAGICIATSEDEELNHWTKSPANPFFGAKNPVACAEQGVPFTGDPNSPYSGIGHNAVFTGPDGGDWLVCHYAEKGKPESLGFDRIWFEGKSVRSNGPSYTEVQVECPDHACETPETGITLQSPG